MIDGLGVGTSLVVFLLRRALRVAVEGWGLALTP